MLRNLLLILLSVVLNSSAQLLIKYAMSSPGGVGRTSPTVASLGEKLPKMLASPPLYGAVAAYGLSFLLWTMVLSRVPVSTAFPFLSLSFILVSIAGWFLFDERMSTVSAAGIALIVLGIILLGLGYASRDEAQP
ncbi:MAG: EamA family transporter [Puniceicoccales bacterium]|jgi:multidrug transporter EmrE-like cation transporter|nr:EamA family transporter [Puniceicoccales bacterium]